MNNIGGDVANAMPQAADDKEDFPNPQNVVLSFPKTEMGTTPLQTGADSKNARQRLSRIEI